MINQNQILTSRTELHQLIKGKVIIFHKSDGTAPVLSVKELVEKIKNRVWEMVIKLPEGTNQFHILAFVIKKEVETRRNQWTGKGEVKKALPLNLPASWDGVSKVYWTDNNNAIKGRFLHERYDCSVLALANGFNLPYHVAHDLCKKGGRMDRKGFNLNKIFHTGKDYNEMVAGSKFQGKEVKLYPAPGMTVKTFARTHSKGVYIVTVTGHVFPIIDGKVINQNNLNARVKYFNSVK